MADIKAEKIETSCIVYATEDFDKVGNAIKNLFPDKLKGKINLKKKKFSGYYGNPISTLTTEIKNSNSAELFLIKLSEKSGNEDKIELTEEFNKHLDNDGNLYLRLDKQAAYVNMLQLNQHGAIKVRISIKKSKRISKESLKEYYRRIGLVI